MVSRTIPKRWEQGRFASVFAENSKKNTSLESTDAFQFYFGSIVSKKKYELTQDLKDTYAKYTLVKPGDIMLNGLNLNYDFVTQRVALVRDNGIITSAYISLRPRDGFNSVYYCYYLKSLDSRKVFNGMGSGIRQTLSYPLLKNIVLPIPPFEEQKQMVSFLDWQVSKINKLIDATKKKIAILKEYRKATIDEGVLHGFGRTDKKKSGIYWLGKIPQSWDILPIKRICKVNASITETAKYKSDDELVTFLPMENVTVNGEVDCSIKKLIGDVRSGYSSFAKGDVVVAKITPCFENGKGACLDCLDTEIGYGTTEFINLRPSEKVLAQYLYLITMTQPFRKLGEEVMSGSAGQKRVPVEFIKNFTLGIPPVEEQKEIIKELDGKLRDIDKLIEKEKETIETLHELKSRLISDVVTGQIDVRDVEVPEFEYVEEIEDSSENDEEADDESIGEEV